MNAVCRQGPVVTFVTVLALLATACAGVIGTPVLTPDARRLHLESFDQVWATVRDRHFDPTLGGLDWPAVRDDLRPRVVRAKTADEARDVLMEMVGRLKQSHFQIIPADLYASAGDGVAEDVSGTVGIEARVLDGRALVTRVVPGSPAEKAGVRTGWEIVRLGSRDVRSEVKKLARRYAGRPDRDARLALIVRATLIGPIAGHVPMTLRDGAGRARALDLGRTRHEGWASRPFGSVPAVAVSLRSERLDRRTGYVTFNAFIDPGRLMPLFNQAITSFLDADGIVIDLRGNTGGLGDMLAGMAGWFIDRKGTSMGTMITRAGTLKLAVTPRPTRFTGPVAVLVDELSMSASEVLAQGLRDAGRARVFGRRTAGAVLASTVERLPSGDGFQYPTARFEFASGTIIEGIGVVPDVEVLPTRETLLAGRDVVLEAAVRWIRNPALKGQIP
jgi:carboxyl-terminal processing protease